MERKNYFSLSADYVTIGMLRERWLRKQEEQKLKEKQEQEVLQEIQILEKDCKNQSHVELEVCHRLNGDIDTVKRQNPRPKEGLDIVEKKNGWKGVEIIVKNKEKVGIAGFPCGESSGTRGIGKGMGVGMTEVLPKNGAREGSSQISTAQDESRDGFRGGFRSEDNDNWDECFMDKEHGVKLKELKDNKYLGKKMEDEVRQIDRKRNGRKLRQKRGQGNKLKQSGAEMSGLKLNEVELKSKDEISEICNERDRMKGLHSGTGRNDIEQNSVNRVVLSPDTLVQENKVEDIVLAEKDRNDGLRGYGDRRRNLREKTENLTIDGMKGRNMGSKVERKFGGNSWYVISGRLDWKMKQCNRVMVWVKKEQSGAVGSEASSMDKCSKAYTSLILKLEGMEAKVLEFFLEGSYWFFNDASLWCMESRYMRRKPSALVHSNSVVG